LSKLCYLAEIGGDKEAAVKLFFNLGPDAWPAQATATPVP